MTRTLKLLLCGYVLVVAVASYFAVPRESILDLLLYLALTHAAGVVITLLLCGFRPVHRKGISLRTVLAATLGAGALVYLAWLVHEFGGKVFTFHFWTEAVPDFKGGSLSMVVSFLAFTAMSLPPTLVAMALYHGRKKHERQPA
jgi:hypothetical protein